MGISDADTTKNRCYFRFVCTKTAHFVNAFDKKSGCAVSVSRYILFIGICIHVLLGHTGAEYAAGSCVPWE
mgnify:FL=1